MVELAPFRAWRYDVSQVGALDDVTAPPYDVIDPDLQSQLYKQHPCNVVRMILNRSEPGDLNDQERHRRAADFWKHWRMDGILIEDRAESLYVYHQQFTWEGTDYLRKGVLGRMRLSPFGEGQVFPHEQTLSGPKADQLQLLRSSKANLSPIFGLYPDDGSIQQLLDEACTKLTGTVTTDSLGVVHRVWAITDVAVLNRVKSMLLAQPVYIADGHHRYETALNYQRELKESGELNDPNSAANFVLTMLVGMHDPGLVICPTHRLVSGLSGITTAHLRKLLGPFCELDETGKGRAGAELAWELVQTDGHQSTFGLGTTADGEWLLARIRDTSAMPALAAGHSARWRSLGVSLLHRLILEHGLGAEFPAANQRLNYVHQMQEVHTACEQKQCDLACLVPAATLDDVQSLATGGETMPPKSTYFYPKLLSGLVFHALT